MNSRFCEHDEKRQESLYLHNLPETCSPFSLIFHKGPYLYDIGTDGEGGGCSNCDNSTDRLREWDSEKGRGVESPENFADVI